MTQEHLGSMMIRKVNTVDRENFKYLEVNTVEKTTICLERISKLDSVLKAMITVNGDEALKRAKEIDVAKSKGENLGMLSGMTFTLKDVIYTKGIRTTGGSKFFENFIPEDDAEVVCRLKKAGAIIIGKNNLHEFAYGGTTQNPFYGSCRNPWDTSRIAGGSSGGSGAAVAADYCDVSLGTDTAGSGRIPAALTGVSALRPTSGRISNHNVIACSVPYDTISPLARRVSDIARVFSVLAGHDAKDPVSADMPLENFLPDIGNGIQGMRIGIPKGYFFDEADSEVRSAVLEAAKTLEKMGAQLISIDLPGAEVAKEYFEKIFHSDATAYHSERLKSAPDLFGDDTRDRLKSLGGCFTAVEYANALRWKENWQSKLRKVFTEVDVILSPTTPVPAPTIEESLQTTTTTRRLTLFSYVWAIAQIPVLVVPCGFTTKKLPISLSLAAAWWCEPKLFQIGCAYQEQTNWHLYRAPLIAELHK